MIRSDSVPGPEPGHPSPAMLERYTNGRMGAAGSPIEMHLERCAACRRHANAAVMTLDPARFAQNFSIVLGELDAPRPGVVERILVRAGIPHVRAFRALPSHWCLAKSLSTLHPAWVLDETLGRASCGD